ncbi:MAG: RagB/SusD family nutrient uptake outer membrane protein [Odoribacteraceae bacterium]|jgi:hypothetical protein|nr:RagB/SusD family nutrient uptake outer membrane protein [Odoribacteraceae bacterium]
MKKYFLPIILAALLLNTACERWLDVKPKAQIEADVLYSREAGYKDVLYNAYIQMISSAMYGCEMTFGLVDVLGNVYTYVGTGEYTYARDGDYTNAQLETTINNIWQSSYNAIANINSLVENTRAADPALFTDDNRDIILAEALGLRAFIHFDLLRLFAPSYKMDPNAFAIPYVTRYTNQITPEYTVAAVIDSILVDLNQAAALLHDTDPIITGRQITANTDDGYLLQRRFRLNYYAVKAVLARVYLYKADLPNAALCADEVINAGKFPWTRDDRIVVTDPTVRDATYSSEQVFALHIPRLSEYTANRLREEGLNSSHLLQFSNADVEALFPTADDWRELFAWTAPRTDQRRYNTKLAQPEGYPDSLANRLPLIRLPELYLISAEASLTVDPEKSRLLVNELKAHRECDILLPAAATADDTRAEILQEYRREFIAEGILFYYYKRLDADQMANIPGNYDKTRYTLPIPAEEIEFGNRF